MVVFSCSVVSKFEDLSMPDERLDAIVPCVKKNPFAKLASLEAPSRKSNGKCH